MAERYWPILGAIALNVECVRKYGFEARGASKVRAKLVLAPPPQPLLELFETVRGRSLKQAMKEAGT